MEVTKYVITNNLSVLIYKLEELKDIKFSTHETIL